MLIIYTHVSASAGNETNVQLGDLGTMHHSEVSASSRLLSASHTTSNQTAGNAMSLTVVCATILAAVTCNQLRQEASAKKKADAILRASMNEGVVMQPTFMTAGNSSISPAVPFLRQLAQSAKQAVQSSVLCVCESTGNVSESFVQCKVSFADTFIYTGALYSSHSV